MGAAVPNWADVRPQGTHRTQSNGRRFADWRHLCAPCVLCLFSTPQWVVGHQALATSRRVERLSENRTVPTGCVRFANDHKLLHGNICSMSKTGYVAKIRPAFSATNFTNLHESSFCLRGNSCHSWQESAMVRGIRVNLITVKRPALSWNDRAATPPRRNLRLPGAKGRPARRRRGSSRQIPV